MQVILWRVDVLCQGSQCHLYFLPYYSADQMQWAGIVVHMEENKNVVVG
jgi:hypothetical protein